MSSNSSPSGFDLTPPDTERRHALEAGLTSEERSVLLEHGTGSPFCGALLDNKKPGAYCCKLCGLPLFRSGERSEEHTSELQSLMRISYAVFCLKKNNNPLLYKY